jgi:tRNA-2-methylthio-N6-dimethylallyladenosine synthase
MPVLLEKKGRFEGQLVGRSPYLQPVHVSGSITEIGTIRNVEIEAIGTNSLSGHYASVENDSGVKHNIRRP